MLILILGVPVWWYHSQIPILVIEKKKHPYLRDVTRIEEWDCAFSWRRKKTTWARQGAI